ncbi:response regulator [Corallococcus exercitus]|uniref:histidine kinase n=1 Tax=Corallococcus exercitus TaxID=2316736 RepID=A0A7Y4KPA0_9BACT|nr:response regulator [Corallococcus exercitus]NOK37411.1 response regulator [Corallococcus exercitus]
MSPPRLKDAPRVERFGPALPPSTFTGFAVAALAVLAIALLSYRTLQTRASTGELVTHTFTVMAKLEELRSTVKDAETGQRGFLLTGGESYLSPYTLAKKTLPTQLAELRALVADSAGQQQRVDRLEAAITEKLAELQETVDLQLRGEGRQAIAMVNDDRGLDAMRAIRDTLDEMELEERTLLTRRYTEFQASANLSLAVTLSGSAVLFALLGIAAYTTARDFRARAIESWLQAGQAALGTRMQGDQRLDRLGENILRALADTLDAQVGALYLVDATNRFRRVAGHALPPDLEARNEHLAPGEGLAGQALKDGRAIHLRDVPEGYLPIASGLARGRPRHVLIAPAQVDGQVNAVVELGFLHPVHPSDLELLQRVSDAIGVAVRASHDRTRLEELLEETQRQAEELQVQQEELRVSNEEIEEQSRVLKESQSRLMTQQAELEQTNAQLEEQARLLETQRDSLVLTQATLTEKATELERTSRYKSEFLANMSHELRTPLNSSLILAKLLADNKEGNLTAEQVKFAQTIGAAGNDLLALINDILDLSRIEAGKVEVQWESVGLQGFVESLGRTFQPVAGQKGLRFTTTVAPDVPATLETDPQRLGQVLKNLLANAFKFTESGEVALTIATADPARVTFSVRDSGIGIPRELHCLIFEAFRQADGSTHRKYGGTGLGLSISRDLARLMGGDVTVKSAPGEGSTFTVTLPLRPGTPVPRVREAPAAPVSGHPMAARAEPMAEPSSEPTTEPPAPPPGLEDDRERLTSGSRVLLVVEDDARFALVLRDQARELGFQCVLASTATDGLAAALRYTPHAIILDMSLPDHSGFTVLDQLKRNPRTRHIPVHVMSAADRTREALELGAVGFALKPVPREQLLDVFRTLETKAAPGPRRVLVVEDDARQRESLQKLLETEGVQVEGIATAHAALQRLREHTFDCIVMDLHLPDLSGHDFLERMAAEEGVSFPPVIVYTGHTLSRDEEQRLRRFSRSIIIKGVRSPERLLDEVTLFLHQVESRLPPEHQRMLQAARDRESTLEGRRILVVEDDVRNIFALSSVLEPRGAKVEIARNGKEALALLTRSLAQPQLAVDLVLMDVMMPEMDGITATREIRKQDAWRKLPIIALTAKAMRDDQEKCLQAGANDYIAKPLDVEKLLSLLRVWMPKA